jgi:hypothetical protein
MELALVVALSEAATGTMTLKMGVKENAAQLWNFVRGRQLQTMEEEEEEEVKEEDEGGQKEIQMKTLKVGTEVVNLPLELESCGMKPGKRIHIVGLAFIKERWSLLEGQQIWK